MKIREVKENLKFDLLCFSILEKEFSLNEH